MTLFLGKEARHRNFTGSRALHNGVLKQLQNKFSNTVQLLLLLLLFFFFFFFFFPVIAPHISWVVPVTAGILCDKASVLGTAIKDLYLSNHTQLNPTYS
jgi:hypothetical protein